MRMLTLSAVLMSSSIDPMCGNQKHTAEDHVLGFIEIHSQLMNGIGHDGNKDQSWNSQ